MAAVAPKEANAALHPSAVGRGTPPLAPPRPQDPHPGLLRLPLLERRHVLRRPMGPHLPLSLPFSLFPPLPRPHRPHLSNFLCALFVLLCNGSALRRREPAPPRVTLRQLVLAVDVFHGDTVVLSAVKPGSALECAGEGAMFRFDMGAGKGEGEAQVEPAAGLRVMWTVVGEGWEGAAVLMDCRGKGRLMGGGGGGSEAWFSEELPPPACCSGWSTVGGLVAEVGLGLGTFSVGAGGDDEGKTRRRRRRKKVVKVVVGLMSAVSWRYVHVDDGLRYRQHFFSGRS